MSKYPKVHPSQICRLRKKIGLPALTRGPKRTVRPELSPVRFSALKKEIIPLLKKGIRPKEIMSKYPDVSPFQVFKLRKELCLPPLARGPQPSCRYGLSAKQFENVIREMKESGSSYAEIASMFGLTRQCIQSYIRIKAKNPGKCQRCGTSNGRIHGHHRSYLTNDNYEFLCWPCHKNEHRLNLDKPGMGIPGKMFLLRKTISKLKNGDSFVWEGNKLPYRVAERMNVKIATRKQEDGSGYRVWRVFG